MIKCNSCSNNITHAIENCAIMKHIIKVEIAFYTSVMKIEEKPIYALVHNRLNVAIQEYNEFNRLRWLTLRSYEKHLLLMNIANSHRMKTHEINNILTRMKALRIIGFALGYCK